MNINRIVAGLGMAALLTVTAACGSDGDEKKKDAAAKESTSQSDEAAPSAKDPAPQGTDTPEGTGALYLQAMADLDFAALCEVLTDGEIALRDHPEGGVEGCAEAVALFLDPEDESVQEVAAQAKQAIGTTAGEITEISEDKVEIAYEGVGDTGITLQKINDEWLVLFMTEA